MQDFERRGQYIKSDPDSQSIENPWQILAAGEPGAVDRIVRALKGLQVDTVSVKVHQAYCPDQAGKFFGAVSDICLMLLPLTDARAGDWIDFAARAQKDFGSLGLRILAWSTGGDRILEKELLDAGHIDDVIAGPPEDDRTIQIPVINALKTVNRYRNQPVESRPEEKKAGFKDLIETIGDLIWETGRNHMLSYVSANAKALWGYKNSFLRGEAYDFSMNHETRSDAWADIKAAMAEQREFTNTEISRIHKNGTPKYFLASGRPFFNEKGIWMGYRGIEKDVTALEHSEQEKKQLIAQLRHAQRLEAMGSLAGGIAHDFNNILGGILGYTQLIQFEIKDNDLVLGHTEHIISGCNRAKNLILQILDFSRQREWTTPPKMTMPGEIVTEAVKLLRASIPSSIKITSEIQKDAGPILADGSQIHQAVMNLCTNARQAIESGQGRIGVQVASLKLTPENHTRGPELDLDFGDYVTIAVTDTGKGIESNTLEKIFNPYFTTKKRGDGTGLGLSVVHGIVTRFNGLIRVDTNLGSGSTFTLYFPRHMSKKPPKKKNTPRLMRGMANILFIDDEPMLVDIGRMMLEKLGYKVTALEIPLKGLEMIESDPSRFDVVITDMTMPDILGTQLALRAKQLNPLLPVVLATGFSNIVQTQKANPSGIDAVLPKPITMASLSQTLHQLLSH